MVRIKTKLLYEILHIHKLQASLAWSSNQSALTTQRKHLVSDWKNNVVENKATLPINYCLRGNLEGVKKKTATSAIQFNPMQQNKSSCMFRGDVDLHSQLSLRSTPSPPCSWSGGSDFCFSFATCRAGCPTWGEEPVWPLQDWPKRRRRIGGETREISSAKEAFQYLQMVTGGRSTCLPLGKTNSLFPFKVEVEQCNFKQMCVNKKLKKLIKNFAVIRLTRSTTTTTIE